MIELFAIFPFVFLPALGAFALVIPLVLLFILVFEVWMFIDLIKNPTLTPEAKLLWALGMLFFHPIVAIVYYFVSRSNPPR